MISRTPLSTELTLLIAGGAERIHTAGSTGVLRVTASGLDFLTDIGAPGAPASRCTVVSPPEASCPLTGVPGELFVWLAEPADETLATITFTA